jgi:hypothetical protein
MFIYFLRITIQFPYLRNPTENFPKVTCAILAPNSGTESEILSRHLRGVGSRGEFYLNNASYILSCILCHFVLFCWLWNSPFSNKDRVIYISQSRMPIRQRRCINILFIFAGQWKARVINIFVRKFKYKCSLS